MLSKLLKISILAVLLAGHQAWAKVFEVVTNPEGAEVYVDPANGKKPVKLGNTPIKMSSQEVFSQTGESKSFMLTLKKEGYDPYRVMMIKTPGVDYKMEVLMKVSAEVKTIKEHDLLIADLFKAQRLIRANNFSDAMSMLDELEKDHKDFSIISELKGIAYYMQKDLNNALSMFRAAFNKNSKNRDAYKMKVYLEKRLGIDAEAN